MRSLLFLLVKFDSVFIAYTDVSGRPEKIDEEDMVLASIIINERNYQYIDNGIKQIKLSHFPDLADKDVELHAKDMLNHSGIFKTMSWDKIYAVFTDMFDFLADPDTDLSIISVLIRKKKLYSHVDPEIWSHRLLFERLNTFIEKQNTKLLESGLSNEYGIVIMDSEGSKKDQRLRNKLTGMLREGTAYSRLDYIIEDPLFTDSKWRNLSQLVDCVAYGIRKKHRANTQSLHTAYWDKFYTQIEKKFDNSNGSYLNYGLKIFP